MSWAETSPRMRELARDVCTARQYQVLVMRTNGLTLEEIGQRLGMSRQGVHKHQAAAHYKIREALLSTTGSSMVDNETTPETVTQ